jgi:hypothetical protein
MLIFVQQLLYFCTSEVIEPNWRAFMSRLHASEDKPDAKPDANPDDEPTTTPGAPKRTVDELMQDHVDFLATCLKECMLTNSKLLRVSPLHSYHPPHPILSKLTNLTDQLKSHRHLRPLRKLHGKPHPLPRPSIFRRHQYRHRRRREIEEIVLDSTTV